MIPAGFLQELLSRVDIVDVVGRHVELKRGGANFMGLCPFHGEKSPSFSVSPSKQFYYCFGCGASGDAIRFLSEHLGLSFVEAVRDLAQGVGMAVPEEQVSPDERQRRDKLRERRLSLGEVLERAADFYRAQLKAQPRAIDYLKRRGLTGAVAARFGLGFAPPGWRTLAGVFPNYDDPLLEEAGLVRLKEADDSATPEATAERGRYDWFRDRVMFPIRGVDGKVIGFGGRVLDDSKPKYMNSPETPLFSKGRELYGLFEARQGLRDKGYALVVEGYMDVVALAQSGFPNAVATLGTACTAEHVQKLFRFTDSVVFSFDGDAAGRRAAGRALEAALPHATDLRSVKFLFLPTEHDPDSYVRELGPAAFEQQVVQAVPLSRQLVAMASEDADLSSAEGRARMLAQAKPLWTALPDGALKRQLLPELARTAMLDLADLNALWGAAAAPQQRPISRSAQPSLQAPLRRAGRRAPAASADLALRLLLRHSDWWERLSTEDHELLHGLGGAHGDAVAWLERQLTEHGPQTWAALDQALSDEAWHDRARAWISGAAPDEEQGFGDLQRVLQRLWVARLEEEVATLIEEGHTDREALDRIGALRRRIAAHRTAERESAGAS
ncbi:MAG: DNA primase [Betaproteobacteria bacterium]|nr:DNA primase [Betaproteobacteria bacterium]